MNYLWMDLYIVHMIRKHTLYVFTICNSRKTTVYFIVRDISKADIPKQFITLCFSHVSMSIIQKQRNQIFVFKNYNYISLFLTLKFLSFQVLLTLSRYQRIVSLRKILRQYLVLQVENLLITVLVEDRHKIKHVNDYFINSLSL